MILSPVADPGFSPGGGAPTPKSAIIFQFFAENCMKMKEFGPPGGGARVPGAPPWIRQWSHPNVSITLIVGTRHHFISFSNKIQPIELEIPHR